VVEMKVRLLDAALVASVLILAAVIAAGVLVDPEFVYEGGISTDALPLGYETGISTSSLPLGYLAGVSAKALKTGYLAGVSTSAKRLDYALRCFIYVNSSWYALRLRAKLEDGTPIKVTAKVNGTGYEVPEAGLLLNWSASEPACAYVDPTAYIEFPSTVNSYTLKSVEGAEQGVAAWSPFTVKEVVAVYSAPGAGTPPSQPGQQPQPGGGAPSTAQQPTSPVEEWVGRILWWLSWAIQSIAKWLAPLWSWWLLLLLALAALLVYLWWRRRKRFVMVIEAKG
jgi:hypothetical protein